jgi:hypothetical protein
MVTDMGLWLTNSQCTGIQGKTVHGEQSQDHERSKLQAAAVSLAELPAHVFFVVY